MILTVVRKLEKYAEYDNCNVTLLEDSTLKTYI